MKFWQFVLLSAFNPFYLQEIPRILRIVACSNHIIVFIIKRTLIERLWGLSFFIYLFSLLFLFFSSLFFSFQRFSMKFWQFVLLSAFNPFYLQEIPHILRIVACSNHIIVFIIKRTLIERLWGLSFFIYFLFSRYLNKTSIGVQTTFSAILGR